MVEPSKQKGATLACRTLQTYFAPAFCAYSQDVNGQAIPVDGGLTASTPYAGKPI
jgi:hypothetical protein